MTDTSKLNISKEILDGLSEEEQRVLIKTLSEMSGGDNTLYNKLVYADYKEIPVDIITFITDDNYLGKAWKTSEGKSKIFKYWRNFAKKLFPDNLTTSVNNAIFSGARGLGKSEWAVTFILYQMYKVMCLKDPHSHFNLKPTEKICFAFMNITKTLAEDIGVSKFQETVKSSPWFLSHGNLTGRDNIMWEPPDPIHIIIGSQASHVIGQAVYACLDEDTMILTDSGYVKIIDMVDHKYRVATVADDGSITYSDECCALPTKKSTIEYEIELEDGTVIKCTPEHRFMLKDGTYKEAQYLTEEDDLFFAPTYGYVYKTTNNVNGKIYVGQHKCSYFDASYLGSGININRAITKYGINSFSVELLEWCSNKNELDEKETKYITLFKSTDPNIGYNIACGGQGGDLGDVVRKKISGALTGRVLDNSTKQKISNSLKGNTLSDETKTKISNSNKGKTVSSETRKKMCIAQQSRDKNSFRSGTTGKVCITDGKSIKYIDKEASLPDGFTYGNCFTKNKHNMSRYYASDEAQKNNSASKSGNKNSMFGNGYRVSGGKNGKATITYYYRDLMFDCRKELISYLDSVGKHIPKSAIRGAINNQISDSVRMKYADVLNNLTWRLKNEN